MADPHNTVNRMNDPHDMKPGPGVPLPMTDYQPIMALYNQPWRRAHNRQHIWDVHRYSFLIIQGNGYADKIGGDLFAAIDLHDAIYVPGRTGNEAASASLAMSYGYKEAARLIDLTWHHKPRLDDLPGMVLCDADLYCLAEDYLGQRARVVSEIMQWHGQDFDYKLWHQGRRKWINHMLARPYIFSTPWARDHYDEQVRDCLVDELKELEHV